MYVFLQLEEAGKSVAIKNVLFFRFYHNRRFSYRNTCTREYKNNIRIITGRT